MSDESRAATVRDIERLSERVEQGLAQIFEYLEQFSATTASYFQKVDARFERIEARIDGLETKVARLEAHMRGFELRMDRIEAKVDGGFSSVNERLQRLEAA